MIDISKGLLGRGECQEKIVGEFHFFYHFLLCFFPFWAQAHVRVATAGWIPTNICYDKKLYNVLNYS